MQLNAPSNEYLRNIEVVVNKMYKPKREIKKIDKKMVKLIGQFNDNDITALFGMGENTSRTAQNLQEENQTQ